MTFDDVTLGAFADGELPADEAARIDAETARDPALAARIQSLLALRRGLASAYDSALSEPSPERLLAAIRGETNPAADVISLAEHRTRRQSRAAAAVVRWGALAASLVLAVGIGRYVVPLAPVTPFTAGPSGLMARGELASALDHQLASAQGPHTPVKIGVSFLANDGRYCRTFILRQATPLAGLACRGPSGWQVSMTAEAEPESAAAGGYQTAADQTPTPILERVDAVIRGRPLDAVAEAKARAAGWNAQR